MATEQCLAHRSRLFLPRTPPAVGRSIRGHRFPWSSLSPPTSTAVSVVLGRTEFGAEGHSLVEPPSECACLNLECRADRGEIAQQSRSDGRETRFVWQRLEITRDRGRQPLAMGVRGGCVVLRDVHAGVDVRLLVTPRRRGVRLSYRCREDAFFVRGEPVLARQVEIDACERDAGAGLVVVYALLVEKLKRVNYCAAKVSIDSTFSCA